MRQFTHRQPTADIRIKPQIYKPDPDVNLKHHDLYARASEYDYEQPIFEAENNIAAPPNPHEIQVQTEILTQEMRKTPGIAHECPQKYFLEQTKSVT